MKILISSIYVCVCVYIYTHIHTHISINTKGNMSKEKFLKMEFLGQMIYIYIHFYFRLI